MCIGFWLLINRYDLILHYFEIGWLPMLEYGKTKTIWETWVPSSSECHAWSATPAYDLSTYWLGVKPLEPGFARVEISPTFFGLQWVDGIFPSCRGDIGVKWTKNIATTGTQIDLSIEIPPAIADGVFILPTLDGQLAQQVRYNNNETEITPSYSLVVGLNQFQIEY